MAFRSIAINDEVAEQEITPRYHNANEPERNRFNDRDRFRTESAESWISFYDDDFDILEPINQAKRRFFFSLMGLLICGALFFSGLIKPIVEVIVFPDGVMEQKVVISLLRMLAICLEEGVYLGFLVILWCVVCIPLLLFGGILVIIWDNFFATGWGHNKCLAKETHALIASLMYVSMSYQALMVFLPLLLKCFFNGFGQTTLLRGGFYSLAGYCFVSIGLIQVVEGFKIGGVEEDFDLEDSEKRLPDADLNSGGEAVGPITGLSLRRKYSSFFPSLPGIKETRSVDAFQVTFFQFLFLGLLVIGFDQPLLDIRVTLAGVALERMVLSLKDLILKLSNSAPVVAIFFTLFVIVIPVLYGTFLFLAGMLDECRRCCSIPSRRKSRNCFIHYADILRPWVMIDVFGVSLVIILFGMQNDYVVATIPDGIIELSSSGIPRLIFGAAAKEAAGNKQGARDEVFWLQFFSGIYLIVGSAVAVIFLRWFWSTNAGMRRRRSPKESEFMGHTDSTYTRYTLTDDDDSDLENEEPCWTRTFCGKYLRCLLLWTLLCLALHGVARTLPEFRLLHMNTVIRNTIPKVNKMMSEYLPRSYGSCDYPPKGVPQPCYEDGPLDLEIQSDKRISALWMAGLDTLQFTDVSIKKEKQLAAAAPVGWNIMASHRKVLNHYTLSVSGVLEKPRLFLRIEKCEMNTETLKPILGKGKCEKFLETDRSCCKANRTFRVQIAAECREGEHSLANVRVEKIDLDYMAVKPKMMIGKTVVHLANKNITKTVMKRVKENIRYYLIEQKLFVSGGVNLTFAQLLNRVLRFNAPHQEFHCR